MYHRDYQEREPVEITIEPDKISILSYSGPDRSVTIEAIRKGELLRSRRYRNRRLGDFLKELDLTEGRSTGIPTIQDELRRNGSPKAIIETDPDRTYFMIDIPCREGVETTLSIGERRSNDRVKRQSNDRVTTELVILEYCLNARSRRDILEHLNLKYHSDNYKKYIKPLVDKGYLHYTEPKSPSSPTQKYITSVLGKEFLS